MEQVQYTILVTEVIGSAVVPTLIAQAWFLRKSALFTSTPEVVQALDTADVFRDAAEVTPAPGWQREEV
jgi:hypothetical protein